MRIALVSQPLDGVLPPMQNSIGIWTYEVARRLARGSQVTVYTRRERLRQATEVRDGVTYRGISRLPDRYIQRLMEHVPSFWSTRRPMFASWLYDLGYILQVGLDVARRGCQIVHMSNISQFPPIVKFLSPHSRTVLRMTCEWLSQLDPAMLRRRLKHVDCILGNGRYIADKIREAFPQYADRCGTVTGGVSVEQFNDERRTISTRRDDLNVLYVGRVSPEKGLHVLLGAFPRVVSRYPRARLDIVGPNGQLPASYIVNLSHDRGVASIASFYDSPQADYASQLRLQASRLKIADRVAFRGGVAYDTMVQYYRKADVLVNPSFSEALGRSLIEAISCKVPVVATRVGGTEEVVEHGKTGLLVEPGDSEGMADAILAIASADRATRRSMAQAARRHAVEKFSWERVTSDLLEYYRRICPEDV